MVRNFLELYQLLIEAYTLNDIEKLTGCQKPCHYKQYTLVAKLTKSLWPQTAGLCPVGLWVASPHTKVETEELIYPWTSLVAEFGGTLGLFLGVSCMTLWDWGRMVGGGVRGLQGRLFNWAEEVIKLNWTTVTE